MPPQSRLDAGERVNGFPIGDAYLFRHYFEGETVFDRLREYYQYEQYRFAVPTDEFDGVRRFLRDHEYALDAVPAVEEYAVVVRKYTAHPDNIFEASVCQYSRGDHTVFVMKDDDAVRRAVAEGATRLRDSPMVGSIDEQMRLSAVNG